MIPLIDDSSAGDSITLHWPGVLVSRFEDVVLCIVGEAGICLADGQQLAPLRRGRGPAAEGVVRIEARALPVAALRIHHHAVRHERVAFPFVPEAGAPARSGNQLYIRLGAVNKSVVRWYPKLKAVMPTVDGGDVATIADFPGRADLRFATFNVRTAKATKDKRSWNARRADVARQIIARNPDGARQFLVDLIDNFASVFRESEFYNLPCYPDTVPDLAGRLAGDPKAQPLGKYAVLASALDWSTNVGFPGYATAGIDEVFNTFVIPTMFARVARDEATPEDAVRTAQA